MLKKRIIGTILQNNGIVVQSINFTKFLPVGKTPISIEFLNSWGIDEIILLDISNNSKLNFMDLKKNVINCFVPLTVGGGIKSISDVDFLMSSGADKISLNSAAIYNPDLIKEVSKIYGNQCVVISIDAIKINNAYKVYDYKNSDFIDLSIKDLILRSIEMGAGEILINSVDRDGSYKGYDFELINMVCETSSVPVICSGGARNSIDFTNVFNKTEVYAAAASNLFHFTEHSVRTIKSNINNNIKIRKDSHVDYSKNKFDHNLRLNKKSDNVLEKMLFEKIEKEII